jgi:hypothetical protein
LLLGTRVQFGIDANRCPQKYFDNKPVENRQIRDPQIDGASALEQVFRRLHLTERITYLFANAISPANQWQDPFAGLIKLGHEMIIASMTALGAAGLLSSITGTAATTAFNVLTFDWPAAGAGVLVHLMMQFLATPIFLGCNASSIILRRSEYDRHC